MLDALIESALRQADDARDRRPRLPVQRSL